MATTTSTSLPPAQCKQNDGRRASLRARPLALHVSSRYVDGRIPVILASARKHGVSDEDIIHAYQ